MRRLVPTNWCFLFYWVFLVNFGPSFHHADLFGLHAHTAGSAHCGLHHSHSHNLGCCDDDHGTDDGHRHPVPQDLEASEALVSAPDGECVCCKFFDQYNVWIDCVEFEGDHTFGSQRFSYAEGFPSSGDLTALARGPPSFVALI
jgi:hypothetical protein